MTKSDYFPNYDYASQMAWKTLISADIKEFPFSLFKLYARFPRIKLQSYVQYAFELSKDSDSIITPNDIALMVKSNDGATQRLLKDDNYHVLFDADCTHLSVQRIRFTLAHELGHYVLRHFYNSQLNEFQRSSFTPDKTDPLVDMQEKEANRFARELLAPVFIIEKFENGATKNDISRSLDISPDSSQNVINYYNSHIDKEIDNDDFGYEAYFSNSEFHERWNSLMPNNHRFNAKNKFIFCKNCDIVQQHLKGQHYCMLCGSSDIMEIEPNDFFQFHENYETYSKDILKSSFKSRNFIPDKCPFCGNFVIDPETRICPKCHSTIRNQCVPNGELPEPLTLVSFGKFVNDNCIGHHKKALPDYARYCPTCGKYTTYSYIYGSNWVRKPFDDDLQF